MIYEHELLADLKNKLVTGWTCDEEVGDNYITARLRNAAGKVVVIFKFKKA